MLYCNRVPISNYFRDNGHFLYLSHDLDLSASRDVIGHVTNRSAICDFLLVSQCNRTSICNRFRDIRPPIPVRAHTHTHRNTNTYKRILMGNRREMALWGIDTSPQDHSVYYFSIAFTRWRYQFPHRDTQRQQWLPTTGACEGSVSGRFAAHLYCIKGALALVVLVSFSGYVC